MKKQYFSPDRDGFYGVYYPNPAPGSKAMIALLGDSSDGRAVKFLQAQGNRKTGIAGASTTGMIALAAGYG